MRRPVTQVVEDFLWTYDEHQGDLNIASQRLNMKPASLARSLYRAKKRGHKVQFCDTTQRGRK